MSSAPAAGFTDTTSTDVDCIKMFGITQGATATTYDPTGNIPRWQMALFLSRMYTPMGLAAGTTTFTAFTDISGYSTEIQDAINKIAASGITVGTSAGTYSPADNVTRAQMALFLRRMGLLTKPYDVASNAGTANGIFVNGAAPGDIADQSHNFSDIALTSIETWEAIAAMYNLGATAETCTATTATTCQTTYRPNEDITRAEMATMIKAVLDASNARPAGCTIQNTQALVAAGSAETTGISCRNADFTPQLNVTVDEFYQVRNDTSAATAALSVPFNALSGLVSTTAGSGVTGVGTAGTIDSGDRITNALGNASGAGCAAAAAATCRHWVHTGAQGTVYINGSTAGFLWEGSLAAGAAAKTYATTITSAISGAALSAACDLSSVTNVTNNDGECTYQGTSRTITTTFTGASTAAIVDGYTVKYTDKVISYGGGTGNQSINYNITYVPVVNGVATLTITCSADHLPLASNAANDGAPAAAEYYEAHEVTLDLGTAAAGTGYPVGGSDITTFGGNTDIGCDDVPRAYSDGQQTLAVNQNYATVSTAGTLASATATAYDQYGVGIAGVSVTFDTETTANAVSAITGARTAQAGAANAQRSTLITNSAGVATYSGVVCDTASVGLSGTVAFHIDDAGGATEISDTALSVPSATVEGTTIHCVVPASGTATTKTMTSAVADAAGNDEVFTIYFKDAAGNLSDPKTGGKFYITIGDASTCGATFTTAAIDGNATAAQIKAAIELLTCVNTVTVTAASTTWTSVVVAHLGNTGNWPDASVAEGTSGEVVIDHGDDSALDLTIATTTAGAYGTTFDHIDHDAAANKILAKRTVKQRTAAGAAVVTTDYSVWTYDDTDVFNTAAIAGATMAQWEAGLKADAGTSATDLTLSYRLASTTGSSGVSSFKLG